MSYYDKVLGKKKISKTPIQKAVQPIEFVGCAKDKAQQSQGNLTSGYIPYWNANYWANSGLFWDSTNSRVGINEASPDTTLEISGAGTILHLDSTSDCYLNIDKGVANSNSFIVFSTAYGNKWYAGCASASIGAGDDFVIHNASTGTPYFFIERGAGNVGIGTASPTVSQVGAGFHIDGSNAGQRFSCSNGGWGYIEFADETPTVKFITGFRDTDTSYRIIAGTSLAATTGLIVDSSGNVGIGTASPSQKLDVEGIITINADSTGDKIYLYSTTYSIGIASGCTIYDVPTGSYHNMRVNDVEIAKVDVNGIKCSSGNFISNDGSTGWTGTFTNGDGDTVTVKNGIITDVS